MVVPGIGGSILSDNQGRPVWGDARRQIVQLLANPERLSLERMPMLHPTGLMASAGYIPPFRLHGYDGLVRSLRRGLEAGRPLRVDTATPTVPAYVRDLSADVVLFPYDFRYGVRAAAERLAEEVAIRLAEFPAGQRERRVIVVGHSMGGLAARYWATLPDQAQVCRAVITVGTPHQGAPKALDWVINGAGLGPGPVRGVTGRLLVAMTGVLRGWPGVYDLLPTYSAIRDDSGGTILRPADLPSWLADGFATDPAYAAGVSASAEMYEQITAGWSQMTPQVRPPVVPFLARDHGTPSATYLRQGSLTVMAEDPPWQPNAGWRGDGTVPAISAIPAELQGRRELEHPVSCRHTPMASAGEVVQVLRALTGDAGPVRGDEADRLRLGVDIADAMVLGDAVPVVARLSDLADPRAQNVSLWLTATSADRPGEAVQIPMTPAGESWTGEFTPATSGAWQVRVEATGVTGQPAPRVEDTVAVIDPNQSLKPDDDNTHGGMQ